jgi:hypothetical protein
MKSKSPFAAAALTFVLVGNLFAQTFSMNQVNQLIQSLVDQKVNVVQTALDEQALSNAPEFTQLQTLAGTHWNAILSDFNSIAAGNEGKIVMVDAFQSLGATDYMSVLEALGSKFAQGQIEKPVMLASIFPTGRMRAFLADNYQHPRVQAFLADMKPRFAADAETQAAITSLENGTTKTELDHFREGHQDTSEGNIPVVPLAP